MAKILQEEYLKSILTNIDETGKLKSRESNNIEFKENFNKSNYPKYAKTMASYSNNRGGYIVFGVTDKPRTLKGLSNDNFDNMEQEKFTEVLNSLFAPEIEWDCGTLVVDITNGNEDIEHKKIGWIYVEESLYKPVIAQKNCDSEKFANGDILYRYRARSQKIKYAELNHIIEENIKNEREKLFKLFDTIRKSETANLGIVNAKGLSFLQLKSQVEAIVSKNYPMGGVQFVLLSPAMFNVKVSGDVSSSTEAPAWALSRLSTVVVPLFTDYSSSRDIQVISADGTKKVYDLFLAERNGDFSNNPYLRPGDNIIVSEAKRKVRIDGAVKRPGVYELLDGENLNALVEKYGDGLTPYADTSRIDLLRITNEPEAGKMYYFKDDAIKSDISIDAYDYVKINSYEDLRAAMFIEGAIATDVISEDLEGVVRRTVYITNGEKYSDLIQRYKHLFTATSDLVNAYIIRTDPESESKLAKTRNIPINLEKILFDVNYYDSEVVCPNDVLIVPFRQFFVSVAGAVATPGRFPYIPDRDWNYYVGLAGGIDTFKNAFKSVEITDKDGNPLKKDDLIPPEATITVKSNNAFYKWNQVAGGVTAILTAISTVLSIYMIATNQ